MRLLMAGWDCYRRIAHDPGLHLVIAGAGPLEPEIAAWASTRPEVDMLGHVDADTCADAISRSRAVLVPSAWEETFGLVVVEAMAAGVPPIAAAHGSLPELITPGVDGVLFPPGDPVALALALADVEANPERYETLGHRARSTYETKFDPASNLRQLLEIYRFAIANPI